MEGRLGQLAGVEVSSPASSSHGHVPAQPHHQHAAAGLPTPKNPYKRVQESAHHVGHAAMTAYFQRRFWVSLIVTLPILLLSMQIQEWLGVRRALASAGSSYVLFVVSSLVLFYGGWPFLKGIYDELMIRRPGMMTLIAVAVTTACVYGSATVFGLRWMDFFSDGKRIIVAAGEGTKAAMAAQAYLTRIRYIPLT